MTSESSSSPGDIGLHADLPRAVALHQADRLDEARSLYEHILSQQPDQFDALHLLGVIALQEGRLGEAQDRIAAALRIDPANSSALGNLAAAYLRDRKFAQALEAANSAAECEPDSVDALINMGTALFELGRYGEATIPLAKARGFAGFAPRSNHICNLLGACYLRSANAPDAVEAFEAATIATPDDAGSWSNLSTAFNAIGEHERALEAAERAVALNSESGTSLGSQAAALFELGKVDEAIAVYRKAVNHVPSVEVLCAFANALLTTGLNDEAIVYLRRAVETDKENALARWTLAMSYLKPIYATAHDMDESRTKFAESMDALKTWLQSGARPYAFTAVGAAQPFYIAYQERNNRDLLRKYGEVCTLWMRSFQPTQGAARIRIPKTHKMRIGIASGHIRDHSVWNAITKGWLYNLDRSKFEIFLFRLNDITDGETSHAKQHFDHFEDREKTLDGWVGAIKNAQLDFLIYPQMGMDAITYQLAAQRLAPLQAVSWGHPETSGMPNIDYYLSGEAIEPVDAQENYSEKLVRLPNLGICIKQLKPKIQDANLKGLGLPRDEPLLLCPGMPFKYLPSHDSVWIEIAKGLQAHGSGRLVFFSGTSAMFLNLLARLRNAFASAGVDFSQRVCVSPMLGRARFFGLMQKSTLLLDTLGFSGINTALQGLECGLPVLAYEGKFMRGRLASGVMRTAGIPELVATSYQEFAQRAVQLSQDKSAIKRLRKQIEQRRGLLFDDVAAVNALGTFLETEIRAYRARLAP